jgi:hypothetical protein
VSQQEQQQVKETNAMNMSNKNDSNDSNKDEELPTFSGNTMPLNVSIDVEDDVGEEVTRRIGGFHSFNPSFEPVSFQPQVFSAGPSINTVPQKASIQSETLLASSSGWNLTEATVLPEFHPLERTAVFVPHTSPAEVARRVSNILRERSIQAEFDQSKAKCVTPDNVEFRVFLYRGQKQYSHGIIVEVQRRFGNSLNFYQDTQAILDAAQGIEPPPAKRVKTLPKVPAEDDEDVSISSLDFVTKLLTHSGDDALYLALQILVSLTDAEKMGTKTAAVVAQLLLTPENEVGTRVFDFIVNSDRPGCSTAEFGTRLMAMTVLCNVLNSGVVAPNMQALLRPVIIEELQKADENPQMAYVSSKCLEPLMTYSSAEDGELYSALRIALDAGNKKHRGLAKEAEKCLQEMER